MPDLWMPGVERRDTGRRLTMRGNHGARIFTHHTFETNYSITRDRAFEVLNNNKSDPHFVFNPVAGWIFQMLPANTGARTLRASGATTNTWGSIHMQVEVIGWAAKPWTSDLTEAGLDTLGRLMEFLRSWGIPDQWCHDVRPPRYPGPGVAKRQPTQSGHFHHAGWVVNNHGDPGAIADPWTLVDVTKGIQDLTEHAEALAAFGYPATEAGVRGYQTLRSGPPHNLVIDGIFGPKTQAALEADMATLESIAAEQQRQARQLDTIEWAARLAANRALYQGPNSVVSRLIPIINAAADLDESTLAALIADDMTPELVEAVKAAGTGATASEVADEFARRLNETEETA